MEILNTALTYINANGLEAHAVSATYTTTRDTTPGIITFQSMPKTPSPMSGTVTISDGINTIQLVSCRSLNAEEEDANDGIEKTFRVADRRIHWKFAGYISGEYNTRDAEGELVSGTEKTLQELITLTLEAMGEKGFDVAMVPDDSWPAVDWDGEPAAIALQTLLDTHGLTLNLRFDEYNTVLICPLAESAGQIEDLLADDSYESIKSGQSLGYLPETLALQLGRSRYQIGNIPLTPMAWDLVAGKRVLKALDKLSYKPSKGFTLGTHRQLVLDGKTAEAALWEKSGYRIFALPDSLQIGEDTPERQELAERILPELVETDTTPDGNVKKKRPVCASASWLTAKAMSDPYGIQAQDKAEISVPFQVDQALGAIIFNKPVFALTSGALSDPAITLTAAFQGGKDDEDRLITEPAFSAHGTGTKRFRRDDLAKTYLDGTLTNQERIGTEAAEALAAERSILLDEYSETKTIIYGGLKPWHTDGVICQISITTAQDGPVTVISTGRKGHNVALANQAERKWKGSIDRKLTGPYVLEKGELYAGD